MATGLKTWSQTASSNGSADDQINYVEGQNPSTINNSGRALMAVMAKWRDDNNGTLTTSNSTNAYTVSTNQSLGTLSDGDTLMVRVNAVNTGAATLNSKSWKKGDGSEFGSGELKEDAIYHLAFHSSDDEWRTVSVQDDPASAITYDNGSSGLTAATVQAALDEIVGLLIPTGSVSAYAANSAPSGWLECDGAAVSRTTYSALFSAIGTTFGPGDGSTTFNLPDLRAEFVRGWDNGKGTDSGRSFGSSQDATDTISIPYDGWSSAGGKLGSGDEGILAVGSGSSEVRELLESIDQGTADQDVTITDNRPRNIALMYIIKT